MLEVEVVDNGPERGARPAGNSAGHGLIGMRDAPPSMGDTSVLVLGPAAGLRYTRPSR